jgi:hypothetical protein
MSIGAGCCASKVLLTVVGLGLYTELGDEVMTVEAVVEHLGLVKRPATDFLDALVSLDLLAREADGARRENTVGPLMSLNMLIEFGDAFDYPGADFREWCSAAGFRSSA